MAGQHGLLPAIGRRVAGPRGRHCGASREWGHRYVDQLIARYLILTVALAAAACSTEPDWQRIQAPWALVSVEEGAVSIVVAMGGDPSCSRFDAVEVTERADSVEVLAYVEERVAQEDEELICIASGRLEPVTVPLSEPLGNRTLDGCFTNDSLDGLLSRSTCDDIQPQV